MNNCEKTNILAKKIANYILDSQSEYEAYNEFIEGGGDPRSTIWYIAATIVGKESDLKPDIDEYLNAIYNPEK